MTPPIYLDHHSTTPLDARVLDAMLPWLREDFGNPANRSHAWGRRAWAAVEEAREQVAAAIGARPSEIVFTSGATESNAIALQGLARTRPGAHLLTTAIEHRSVLDTCRRLEREGWALTLLPVDRDGLVDPQRLAAALRPDTLLVSVMAANNEIGTVQPLAEIAPAVRAAGARLHVDATQAIGRVALDVQALDIDALALSAHKIHGPKGCGMLYLRSRPRRVEPLPLMEGGGQERGLRPGTLNVPGIVGLAAACTIAVAGREAESARLRRLRDRLWARLAAGIAGLLLHGHATQRLPGNLNVGIAGVEADALLLALDGIAVSAGAACASGSARPSHVLQAIGAAEPGQIRAALRFGLGRGNTEAEIDAAGDAVVRAVARLRASTQHSTPTRGPP